MVAVPLGPRPAWLSPLARAPPYACVAMALALVAAGTALALPLFWALAFWWTVGSVGFSTALTEVIVRRYRRKRGWTRCAACKGQRPERVVEVLGFCLWCGARGPAAARTQEEKSL